jgi:hypothetical protein
MYIKNHIHVQHSYEQYCPVWNESFILILNVFLDRTFGVILKMIIWICKENYFLFFPQKIIDTLYVCIAQKKIFV